MIGLKRDVNGITWNVYERGTGKPAPALIFLHYFGGSGRAWLDVMTCLENEYHCIAPDLRGFGDSSDVTAGYTVAQAAEDMRELIAALDVDDYVLAGHSMGGKIAMRLAAQSPPGLRALLLVAPSPPTPEPTKEQERAHLLATHGDAEAARQTLHKITAHPLRPDLFAQAVEDNAQTSALAWAWWLEHGSREDITPNMASIIVPVFAIAGAKDPVIPASLVENEIVRRFATQPASILPDVGHLLPLEAANPLAKLLLEFLTQQSLERA